MIEASTTSTVTAGRAHQAQASVNLNAGNTLLVTNTTNDTFTLVTKPGDGLRYMLEPQEMEHVPFSEPGTYVLSSKEHPATALTVLVFPTRRL